MPTSDKDKRRGASSVKVLSLTHLSFINFASALSFVRSSLPSIASFSDDAFCHLQASRTARKRVSDCGRGCCRDDDGWVW
jgi:hypothetical protein